MEMMIKIAHLYPDMLNLYGDRGNIITLKTRLNARNIGVQVDNITMGKSFNSDEYDMIFIGGGQDFEQDALLNDLKQGKDKELKKAVENGKVVLAICGFPASVRAIFMAMWPAPIIPSFISVCG